MIKVENVSRKFKMGEEIITAVDDISFVVEASEFISIVGPSGSGKSSLMHMLGCLDKPNSGTITIDGFEITDKKKKDKERAQFRNKRIGFVFQNFNLDPNLTALENVQLPLLIADTTSKQSTALAKMALKRVDLADRMDHKPTELSGGQRQRVAIARAIVNEPRVLLADEPTGNLDSKSGAMIFALLKQLSRKDKVTVVVVTHDIELASSVDRQIKMRDGKIIN